MVFYSDRSVVIIYFYGTPTPLLIEPIQDMSKGNRLKYTISEK